MTTTQLIWAEFKELQTLVSAIVALFAARYAYMQATLRDREKAKIIEKMARNRIYYSLGMVSTIVEMISLFAKTMKQEMSKEEAKSFLHVIADLVNKIKKETEATSIKDNESFLLLSPKQFEKITQSQLHLDNFLQYVEANLMIQKISNANGLKDFSSGVEVEYNKIRDFIDKSFK